MAFFGSDVTQSFRSNEELQQFILSGVTTTGKLLGTGSFGSVEEVTYKQISCAGKRLHEALIDVENEGADLTARKYLQECQLMSSLRHPNITQFLGLCFLPGTRLPLLVMERLETSLDDLLEHMPNLPLSLKRSVLEDVASGLLYLHERPSPVIHRDLTARNVLLTSSLVAKITDMGNSRIIDMRPGQMARTLSTLPGTLAYMPPEALDDRHRYGPSLDIFSFGHLALFTIIQTFPGSLHPHTYPNPDNPGQVLGRTEVERRENYIDMLESKIISTKLPDLVQLVKKCLSNVPSERPTTDNLLSTLQMMKAEMEGEYGGPIRLDMVRVRLAKEVKAKNRRIEELTRQKERYEDRLERMRGELEEKAGAIAVTEAVATGKESPTRDELIATKDRDLADMERNLATKDADLETKDAQIQHLQHAVDIRDGQIAIKERELSAMERDLATKESDLATKESDLATKDARIQQLQNDAETKDGNLANMERNVATKDKDLATKDAQTQLLQHAVDTKDGQIASKERDLANKERNLVTKERGLAIMERDLATKEGDLATNLGDLATKEGDLATKEKDLATKERDLATNLGDLATKEGNLATKEKDIVTKERDLATKERDFVTWERNLATKDADIQQLQNDADTKDKHVTNMERNLATKDKDLATKDAQIQQLQHAMNTRDGQIARELDTKERDLVTMKKDLATKDAQIQQLQSDVATRDDRIAIKDRDLAVTKERNLATKNAQIQQLQNDVATSDGQIVIKNRDLAITQNDLATMQRDLAIKNRDLATKERELFTKDAQIQQLQHEVATRDGRTRAMESQLETLKGDMQTRHREEMQSKDAEIRRLNEELKRTRQVPLQVPLRLTCRRGPNMPFGMRHAQSVVVQKRVYVGGGNAGMLMRDRNDYTVMEYDIASIGWNKLPYTACGFAMTAVNNQLVLVGGWEHPLGPYSKVLGVWRAESKEWTHPYPDMSTARSHCSAVVYNEWLAVAGGFGHAGGVPGGKMAKLLSVEVMNTGTKQWYAAPPTPTPWGGMKTAIVGDTWYFMGDYTDASRKSINEVYSVSLPALVPQLHPQDSRGRDKHQVWKEIPGLPITRSTPLSINGSLLAVGGMDKGDTSVTAIHLYQPDTGQWVKVGDLPNPRYSCTCAMVAEKAIFVAGGWSYDPATPSRMDILCIQ